MPKHFAIDVNVLSGSAHLEGGKTIQINFVNSNGNPISFTKAPRVQITLINSSATAPFKTKDVKTGGLFTGIVIGFPSVVTADIEWQISERA